MAKWDAYSRLLQEKKPHLSSWKTRMISFLWLYAKAARCSLTDYMKTLCLCFKTIRECLCCLKRCNFCCRLSVQQVSTRLRRLRVTHVKSPRSPVNAAYLSFWWLKPRPQPDKTTWGNLSATSATLPVSLHLVHQYLFSTSFVLSLKKLHIFCSSTCLNNIYL